MSDRRGPAFYREQAALLVARAAQLDDPLLRVQYADLAASLRLLADFAALTPDPEPPDPEPR